MSGPLTGLRVLDLTRLLPGPFLSQLLHELGADVVKVEPPGEGDYARWIPPDVDGAGYAFSPVNRGKRSLVLDLKAPGGADVALRLAARSDVLLESFRPGVLDRLGLSDEALRAANPKLVRLSLVGYGPGPLRDAVGHDLNYEAMSGLLAMQGAERPVESAAQVADMAGALYGAVGVLAALVARARTGEGRRVEVALADAALALNAVPLQRATAGEPLPARGAWELSGGLPGYRVYRCADDRHVALGCLEPKFWDRFIDAVARPDLASAHTDPARQAEVDALFLERPRDAWVDALAPAGVPITPVLEPSEAVAHPQHARFEGRPGPGSPLTGAPSRGPVPGLGEHTDDVLRDAGYSPDDVKRLRDAGVVA